MIIEYWKKEIFFKHLAKRFTVQTDHDPKNTVKETRIPDGKKQKQTNVDFSSQSDFNATWQSFNYWRQKRKEKDEKQVESEVKANLAF